LPFQKSCPSSGEACRQTVLERGGAVPKEAPPSRRERNPTSERQIQVRSAAETQAALRRVGTSPPVARPGAITGQVLGVMLNDIAGEGAQVTRECSV